jgi:hypothetical protein
MIKKLYETVPVLFPVYLERVVFKEKDRCIMKALSLNGRLFVAPQEHLDALVVFSVHS